MMASQSKFIRHIFAGGWATDFGPTTEAVIDDRGRVLLPFLVNAENVQYDLDGGPKKIGGATKLNSTVIESGEEIRGLFDYWRQGTSGSPTQKRIVHAGTKVLQDDADGVFADLFTGLEDGANPAYETFDDILIIASDSTVDVPKSWDQTTAQNLAGSPPNFAFCKTHKNRLWAAGNVADPSKLYYCAEFDPEDWTGAGSGSISINPGDGDMIKAIASFKDELWVFKGPFKGSIHRITGSAPTGSDAFARRDFVSEGLGAAAQNLVFKFGDDLGFMWTDGSINSLKAVESFGDYREVSVSRPIASWLREHVNFDLLNQAWAVSAADRGFVLITLPIDGSSTNNAVLMMDYRFEQPRWALWDALECASLAMVTDPTNNNFKEVFGGFNDGFVRRLNRPDKSIDGSTAIGALVTTPYIHYDHPVFKKLISAISVGIQPQGAYDLIFRWRRDDNPQQQETIAQGGGDVLAPADSNEFMLGTSQLGGAQFVDRFRALEEGGEFRSIQYEIANSGVNEGLELHSFSTRIKIGAESLEN